MKELALILKTRNEEEARKFLKNRPDVTAVKSAIQMVVSDRLNLAFKNKENIAVLKSQN